MTIAVSLTVGLCVAVLTFMTAPDLAYLVTTGIFHHICGMNVHMLLANVE